MTNPRSPRLLAVLPILILCCTSAFGATVTVDNTYSGWYNQDGLHNNFNTNYFTGNLGLLYNDFFVFNLAPVTGTVTAATFGVNSWGVAVGGTYTIYATTLSTSVENTCSNCTGIYNGLTSGSAIGTIALTPANSYTTLSISLNAGGRSWLTANEGHEIVMGGALPVSSSGYAFGTSTLVETNNLTISTESAAPEPSTLGFMGSGILLFLGGARRLRNRRG